MERVQAEDRPTAARGGVAVLDAALWSALAGTPPLGRFAAAWLALQCRMVDRAIRGVLVLRGEDGAIAPIARWPEHDQGSPDLVQAAELALAERRGLASRSRAIGEERTTLFAFPLTAPGAPEGVVALECAALPDNALRDIIRQLQWGAGWIELHARRTSDAASASRHRASLAAMEITASAVVSLQLRDAARAVVTELAVRLGAGWVAVGRVHRRHIRLLATSHVVAVGKRSTNAAELAAAMEEALDHQASIVYVLDGAAAHVRAIVPQSEIDLVRHETDGVSLRMSSDPMQAWSVDGAVREVPMATRDLPSPVLATAGGGQIATDPSDEKHTKALEVVFEVDMPLPAGARSFRLGERVYVRFDHGARTLGWRLGRDIRQVFLRRFDL